MTTTPLTPTPLSICRCGHFKNVHVKHGCLHCACERYQLTGQTEEKVTT